MSDGGPWVLMATFCRDIEKTPEGTNLVGLTTSVNVDATAVQRLTGGRPLTFQLKLFISVVAGGARGPVRLQIVRVTPAGRREPGPVDTFECHHEGSLRDLIVPATLQVSEIGIYWFEVLADDRLLTRIPLAVGVPGLQAGNLG